MKHPLVLATTNPTKIEKLSKMFAPYFDDIQSQDMNLGAREDSEPLAPNDAAMKAVAASIRYNCPAVAAEGSSHKESIAIANRGKLLFDEEVDSDHTQWDQMQAMVDWFLLAK